MMDFPTDLNSLIKKDSKGRYIQYEEPDLLLTIHADDLVQRNPTQLWVGVVLNRNKPLEVRFETILKSGVNRDYGIDADDEELLVSEMKTFLLRIKDIREKGQQIIEKTLFAPEIEKRAKINDETTKEYFAEHNAEKAK